MYPTVLNLFLFLPREDIHAYINSVSLNLTGNLHGYIDKLVSKIETKTSLYLCMKKTNKQTNLSYLVSCIVQNVQ